MQNIKTENLPLFHFNNLSKYTLINHFISGRKGGVSKGDLSELNLSFKVGDEPENVFFNRKKLAAAMGLDIKDLVFPSQTHSLNIREVTDENFEESFEDTDALITTARGKLICVMSADCVPVLLFDKKNLAVGAVHSGWKGTVGRIVEKTIAEMSKKFGTDPQDLVAGIGPSISKKVYEVGEEVISEVEKSFGSQNNFVNHKENSTKGWIDLWEMNRFQLITTGVKEKNIEVAGICTYSSSENFFSARRSGNKAGRFAAGIMIK